MHSKSIAYFVPRLPPGLVIFQNYLFCFFLFFLPYPPSASPFLPSETGGLRHHRSTLTPLFGRQSPPLSLSFPSLFLSISFPFNITKREEGGGNGGELGSEGRRRGWLPLTVSTSNSRGH